ncbi:hypothetical protein CCACVL1_03715 [Corchorus capsularis]|uniref:Uncharacterized protein n=1 Tax=Corchorus capsularis TaxID=210143 RepID=A0A1R3JXQ7_COCAP|nr:hypothetical protein CCACVL1_03715 [Corchorus capsularis]
MGGAAGKEQEDLAGWFNVAEEGGKALHIAKPMENRGEQKCECLLRGVALHGRSSSAEGLCS